MSSSYQTTGIIETELGTSYLSDDAKNILKSYYKWIDTKYGVSNISSSWGNAEHNNIYSGNNLEDFNLIVQINFSYNSLSNFQTDDIDISDNSITISSISNIEVGDYLNLGGSSIAGSLPDNLPYGNNLYVKTIEKGSSSSYKLTFSETFGGETFNFTDQGSLNTESDTFSFNYANVLAHNFNYQYDKSTNTWSITNYSGDVNNFDISKLTTNPNLHYAATNSSGGYLNPINAEENYLYDDTNGYSLSLTGTDAPTSNTLTQNLTSLGIDLSESKWGTYISDQISTEQNGLVTVIRDSSKYYIVTNSDGNNPEIIHTRDFSSGNSYNYVRQILEDKNGSLFFVNENSEQNTINGKIYYTDTSSVIKVHGDGTIETTSLDAHTYLSYGSGGTLGDIGNFDYSLIPEQDGDIWLIKSERVNGIDGTSEEAHKHTGWRFNKSNFSLSSPDIIIDSVLDMNNHYSESSGTWLLDAGGEEYGFNFSYTNNETTHNNFLTQASNIEQTISYAVSINDNFNVVENSLFVRSFSSYNDVNWSISGGDDASKFKINENTGSLTFVSRPDYENPNDSNKDNIYNILVRSNSSNNVTIDQKVIVNIVDTDEQFGGIKTETIGQNNSSFLPNPKGNYSITDSSPITVESFSAGQKYNLADIRDYDGSLHAGNTLGETPSSYKYQGLLDVNKDTSFEAIFTNHSSGRWVTASIDSQNAEINYASYGKGGTTRVVGIYIDPLVTSGEVIAGSDHDSQRRFQNDLKIDNLNVKASGDYDNDGFQEIYWKTTDNTAYLRALMHADGNIQYANYQNETQVRQYLTSNGYSSEISDIV